MSLESKVIIHKQWEILVLWHSASYFVSQNCKFTSHMSDGSISCTIQGTFTGVRVLKSNVCRRNFGHHCFGYASTNVWV